ncbi:hypothetical protein JCGZ_10597 [Jatropha curcas]|uniref:RNase H type-1 domain-containing protein n=1 Tax=Jatropha curcas TaxID=180498 RepID=A0A067KLI7_JATCU|nr:hypothetical protein JCGZ_10597 [Jatropha curcas]
MHMLSLAWSKGFRQVLVEMDSKSSLELISPPTSTNLKFSQKFSQIHELVHCSWTVHFEYCYREANKVAHRLANAGLLSEKGYHIVVHPPQIISDFLS